MIRTLEQMNIAPRYEINASIRCPKNIRLYEKLGYVRFKETRTGNNGFVYLEKNKEIYNFQFAASHHIVAKGPERFLFIVTCFNIPTKRVYK